VSWDQRRAEDMIGAVVVIGMTYEEAEGPRLEQFHGTVMAADEHDGVVLRLEGERAGEIFTLPPDLDAFSPAREGSYRLRGSGEVIEDPDFTTTWNVTPPRH
jgi:hypothetical protein